MNAKHWCLAVALSLAPSLVWAAPAEEGAEHARGKDTYRSANELIGMGIRNVEDENIGSVVDIVLDSDQSRIAYVIMSYGGVWGVGDKHFAVPWQAFGREDGELTLDVDTERLSEAPGFDPGHLPDQADPLFHEAVHTFYGVAPYSLGDRAAEPSGQSPPDAENAEEPGSYDWLSWAVRDDNGDWARKLSELIGTSIENPAEEAIAELEDVIIATGDARAAYAIVSYGGVLGFMSDTAAVPWAALQLNREEAVYILDATTEELASVKFSASEYEALENEDFAKAIRRPFDPDSAEPVAIEGGDGDGETTVLYGTVLSVGRYTKVGDADAARENVRLRLRTSAGEHRVVHLGPLSDLQDQGCTLRNGDHVSVTGKVIDYRGHQVIEANSLTKNGKQISIDASVDSSVVDTE